MAKNQTEVQVMGHQGHTDVPYYHSLGDYSNGGISTKLR